MPAGAVFAVFAGSFVHARVWARGEGLRTAGASQPWGHVRGCNDLHRFRGLEKVILVVCPGAASIDGIDGILEYATAYGWEIRYA